jgi:hypothetical protein
MQNYENYLRSNISRADLALIVDDALSNKLVKIAIAPLFNACSVSSNMQKCNVSNMIHLDKLIKKN